MAKPNKKLSKKTSKASESQIENAIDNVLDAVRLATDDMTKAEELALLDELIRYHEMRKDEIS